MVKVRLPARSLPQKIGADFGAQGLHYQQVYPAGEQEVFIADGAHQILQHQGVCRVGACLQQLLVGDQQCLTGAGGNYRHRAGQAGAAQHVPKDIPWFQPGDGHPTCRPEPGGKPPAHRTAKHRPGGWDVPPGSAPRPGHSFGSRRAARPVKHAAAPLPARQTRSWIVIGRNSFPYSHRGGRTGSSSVQEV